MVLKKSDFVLIDYTAKVKETNETFDTTIEEIAKKANLHKEGEIYEPKLVVIGEGWVLKTLDESLPTMKFNKSTSVEITPEKAFGPREPEKVKRVSLRQLTAKGINTSIGMRVEFNGKMASIRSIGAGRVLLDFNPPLAGKTLVYEVTIKKKLESLEEKIGALIHRRIPDAEQSNFKFKIEEETVEIEMPEETFYLEGIQVAKRGIVTDLRKFFPQILTTKFVETFKAQKDPEKINQ